MIICSDRFVQADIMLFKQYYKKKRLSTIADGLFAVLPLQKFNNNLTSEKGELSIQYKRMHPGDNLDPFTREQVRSGPNPNEYR